MYPEAINPQNKKIGQEGQGMMEEVKEWSIDEMLSRTAASLERNGFKTVRVSDRKEALRWLLSNIPTEAKVGVGGSGSEVARQNIILYGENKAVDQEVVKTGIIGAGDRLAARVRTSDGGSDTCEVWVSYVEI